MTDGVAGATAGFSAEELDDLRARADALEQQLSALQRETQSRLVHSELKAEAVRAGMIDLDGLKLLDLSKIALDANGEVQGGAALMAGLRRSKPWLFGGGYSSSTAGAPAARVQQSKLATEMTDEEYRAARAALLRRRG